MYFFYYFWRARRLPPARTPAPEGAAPLKGGVRSPPCAQSAHGGRRSGYSGRKCRDKAYLVPTAPLLSLTQGTPKMQPEHVQHLEEKKQLLQLFFSGQAVNIELARLQAAHWGWAQEHRRLRELLLHTAAECGWAIDNSDNVEKTNEILAQLLAKTEIELHYIHHLPIGLTLLPRLQSLEIQHFTMRKMPAYIGKMRLLKRFSCSLGFNCHELPDELCELSELEELHLDNNAIEELPENIGKLQNLRILSLRGNCLTGLPASLGELPKLEKIYLAGNPLRRELIPSILCNRHRSNLVVVNALRRIFKW